jgi:hypothetical protein
MKTEFDGAKKEHLRFPDWQWPVFEALKEKDSPDKEKLKALVMAAETAIFARQQAISTNSDHHAEQRALEDAVAVLRILKTEALDFPDWND